MSLIHQFHIQDSWERHYQIYLPVNYHPDRRVPLLLALHGGGGNSYSMIKLTDGGFNRLADEHNFIVVYPDSIGRQWNDGRLKPRWGKAVDDVDFIRSLIEQLASFYAVNRERVYVTGMSNGGFMAYRLACDLPRRVAGIAPVAALMPTELTPSRAIPLLTIAGRDDPLVPYNGGAVGGKLLRRGQVHSAMKTIHLWAEANGCEGESTTELLDDADPHDGMQVQRIRFPDCRTPVELYSIIGGGHTWPGGNQYLDGQIVGKTSRDFDACQVIWNFFRTLAEER